MNRKTRISKPKTLRLMKISTPSQIKRAREKTLKTSNYSGTTFHKNLLFIRKIDRRK